jgi:hypothetical protein
MTYITLPIYCIRIEHDFCGHSENGDNRILGTVGKLPKLAIFLPHSVHKEPPSQTTFC